MEHFSFAAIPGKKNWFILDQILKNILTVPPS